MPPAPVHAPRPRSSHTATPRAAQASPARACARLRPDQRFLSIGQKSPRKSVLRATPTSHPGSCPCPRQIPHHTSAPHGQVGRLLVAVRLGIGRRRVQVPGCERGASKRAGGHQRLDTESKAPCVGERESAGERGSRREARGQDGLQRLARRGLEGGRAARRTRHSKLVQEQQSLGGRRRNAGWVKIKIKPRMCKDRQPPRRRLRPSGGYTLARQRWPHRSFTKEPSRTKPLAERGGGDTPSGGVPTQQPCTAGSCGPRAPTMPRAGGSPAEQGWPGPRLQDGAQLLVPQVLRLRVGEIAAVAGHGLGGVRTASRPRQVEGYGRRHSKGPHPRDQRRAPMASLARCLRGRVQSSGGDRSDEAPGISIGVAVPDAWLKPVIMLPPRCVPPPPSEPRPQGACLSDVATQTLAHAVRILAQKRIGIFSGPLSSLRPLMKASLHESGPQRTSDRLSKATLPRRILP